MKFILLLLLIFFSNSAFANKEDNSQVEVINLYESKSLDQMVIDNLNEEEKIEDKSEFSDELNESETNQVEVTQIEIVKNNFIYQNRINDLENYFQNLLKINSKTLQKELIEVLENIEFNLEDDKDKEIFILIINYLQSIGQINKSYQ